VRLSVKIQCGCGQRYIFDVEPDNGHMPTTVACPVCGTDGTAAANAAIAQALAASPAPAPTGSLRLNVPASRSPVPPAPPVLPASGTPAAARPQPQRPIQTKATRGKDGWSKKESSLNKLGTFIVATPAILAALLSWGIFGVEVSPVILCPVVGIGGLVGGALNVAGRGPIVAGALVGLIMGMGGYGAVCWWIHGREKVREFEVAIAFVAGALPGFGLQFGLQQLLRRRARSGA
jgi:hypothetical protein